MQAEQIGLATVYSLDEEHYVDGSMRTMVTQLLSALSDVAVKRLGIPKTYAITSGIYRKPIKYYQLDGKGIA